MKSMVTVTEKKYRFLFDLLKILFGNLLMTLAYACITVPHEIINGGVTSFSLVLQALTQIDVAILTNVFSVVLLLICLIFLGKEYFFKSLISSVCYMVMFSFLHSFHLSLPLPDIICMFIAALLVGFGYYFCISANSSAVGFDIIALILHKRDQNISIAKTMRLINIIVLAAGFLCYGIFSIILGIVFTICQSTTLDYLLKYDEKKKANEKEKSAKEIEVAETAVS